MKLELVTDKTVDELKQIWLDYHKDKDVITATVTRAQYEQLLERGRLYPVFILPLPRTQGYEFIMLQFAANTIHFTTLLSYQVHKENAPECLTVTYYTEFAEQDLILMRGEIDTKVLTAQEAQCLANEFQLYYGQNDENKLKLLERFTKQPDSFKHMDVVNELETIQLL